MHEKKKTRIMERAKRSVFSSVLMLVVVLAGCSKPTPEEVEAMIALSPKLQRLDKVCSELPKPEGFRQIEKGISGNAASSIVFYKYDSDTGFDAVKEFYFSKAPDVGYKILDADTDGTGRARKHIRLIQDNVVIVIEYQPRGLSYDFDCVA